MSPSIIRLGTGDTANIWKKIKHGVDLWHCGSASRVSTFLKEEKELSSVREDHGHGEESPGEGVGHRPERERDDILRGDQFNLWIIALRNPHHSFQLKCLLTSSMQERRWTTLGLWVLRFLTIRYLRESAGHTSSPRDLSSPSTPFLGRDRRTSPCRLDSIDRERV